MRIAHRGWALVAADDATGPVRAHVTVAGPVAWRLFTKGISRAEAAPQVQLSGDERLGELALGLVAVMA